MLALLFKVYFLFEAVDKETNLFSVLFSINLGIKLLWLLSKILDLISCLLTNNFLDEEGILFE